MSPEGVGAGVDSWERGEEFSQDDLGMSKIEMLAGRREYLTRAGTGWAPWLGESLAGGDRGRLGCGSIGVNESQRLAAVQLACLGWGAHAGFQDEEEAPLETV